MALSKGTVLPSFEYVADEPTQIIGDPVLCESHCEVQLTLKFEKLYYE